MSTTIWKFPIPTQEEKIIKAPIVRWLSVAIQHGEPQLWAEVDPAQPNQSHCIITRGTGHPMSGDEGEFLGTYITLGGALVFHVFAHKSDEPTND